MDVLSVVIGAMRVLYASEAAFMKPQSKEGVIRTQVMVGCRNSVTSQLIYQAWGIEMPSIQELAQQLQPSVEMLCSLEMRRYPQTIIELSVIDSSIPGLALTGYALFALGQTVGSEARSCQRLFWNLLSSSYLLSGAFSTDSTNDDAAAAASETLPKQAEDASIEAQCCPFARVENTLPKMEDQIPGGQWTEVGTTSHCYSQLTATPDNMDIDPADHHSGPSLVGFDARSLPSRDLEYVDLGDVEDAMGYLNIGRQYGVEEGKQAALIYGDNVDCETSLEDDMSSEDDDHENYWEWHAETKRYRHWEESTQQWIEYPEEFL